MKAFHIRDMFLGMSFNKILQMLLQKENDKEDGTILWREFIQQQTNGKAQRAQPALTFAQGSQTGYCHQLAASLISRCAPHTSESSETEQGTVGQWRFSLTFQVYLLLPFVRILVTHRLCLNSGAASFKGRNIYTLCRLYPLKVRIMNLRIHERIPRLYVKEPSK